MSASVHEASSVVQTSSNPPKVDRENRNRLVVENLPLVGYLVSDICRRASHLSRDDLSSTGALALITAAEAYDPTLGVPFGAFARRRIVGAFADEMRSNDWATRSVRRRIKETLGVRETLTHALGRFPSVDEIAKAMGVDRESAEAALSDASRTVTALEDSAADLKAADVLSPEDSLLAAEKTMFVHEAVAALPGKM